MKTKKEHWRGGGGGVQAMMDLQGWPQQLILCVSFWIKRLVPGEEGRE